MVRQSQVPQQTTSQQTKEDIASDAALAIRLAQEEADCALAIQLSGGQKPSRSDSPRVADLAPNGEGGWVSTTVAAEGEPSAGDPTAVEAPASQLTDPQVSHVHGEVHETMLLKVKVRTRSVFVGCSAVLLAGLSILYFFGYIVSFDWGGGPGYHDPFFYTVASAMLYTFLFLVSVIGLVAATRQNLRLMNIYLFGLTVVTASKIIMSLALTVSIQYSLPRTLDAHGCWTESEEIEEPWTEYECNQYRIEANTAAWIWIFPMLLCFGYIICAAWIRHPMVKYEMAKALARRRRFQAVPAADDTDLDFPPMAQRQNGGRRVTFSETQNNARIQREFGMLSEVPTIRLREHIVTPVDNRAPTAGRPSQEHVTFIPICPKELTKKENSTAAEESCASHEPMDASGSTNNASTTIDMSGVFVTESADEIPDQSTLVTTAHSTTQSWNAAPDTAI